MAVDQIEGTPRVFLMRHGETEWTINGRYTGTTEVELTNNGIEQVTATASMLIGHGKLIDPRKLVSVHVSPRLRAQKTAALCFGDDQVEALRRRGVLETATRLGEWGYGEYEGLLTAEIRARRKEKGLDGAGAWDIWRDGCEGGESPVQVTERVDDLIAQIRAIQGSSLHRDDAHVLLIAHGHILRAFTKRWLGLPMETPLSMMIEPGGVGILSYQHHNIEEPAFLLGMAFPPQKDEA